MAEIKIKRLVLGSVSTNCYILYREDTKQAVLFDPADASERIIETLQQLDVALEGILLTHGHFDHILAADAVRKASGCKIYAYREEAQVASDADLNLSNHFGAGTSLQIDVSLDDGEALELAGFSFQVLHTPGHTKGSACYYLEKEGLLFSGDTLFAGSVGRTDFPTGSGAELMRSVKERLSVLPDETKVLPGHGDTSTIAYEKKNNPYM